MQFSEQAIYQESIPFKFSTSVCPNIQRFQLNLELPSPSKRMILENIGYCGFSDGSANVYFIIKTNKHLFEIVLALILPTSSNKAYIGRYNIYRVLKTVIISVEEIGDISWNSFFSTSTQLIEWIIEKIKLIDNRKY